MGIVVQGSTIRRQRRDQRSGWGSNVLNHQT
jgi:hypothetical protein